MTESDSLSVIVLMHNNVPMTRNCLESLSRAVATVEHEVILVDNASTDDTRALSECADWFQRFRILRNDDNTPFSRRTTAGCAEASGRWLLFLNNDVIVGRESVERLLAPLREDEGIGITGAKLLFPGETVVQHAGIGQMLWGYPTNYGVGASPSDERVNRRCERFALTGAMLCLAREVFDRVGGFDERYIWGVEDIDLCLKIRAAGLQPFYEPAGRQHSRGVRHPEDHPEVGPGPQLHSLPAGLGPGTRRPRTGLRAPAQSTTASARSRCSARASRPAGWRVCSTTAASGSRPTPPRTPRLPENHSWTGRCSRSRPSGESPTTG